jgi:PAS domain S-box-containing protein
MANHTPTLTGWDHEAPRRPLGPGSLHVADHRADFIKLTPTHILSAAALFALIASLLTLLGWASEVHVLTDWVGSGITQKPNNALAAVLCSSALLMLVRTPRGVAVVRFLAISAAVIGGLTLIEHLTGINLGIDTLLFDELPGERATAAPGRMGPTSALSFLVIGLAIVLSTYDSRRQRLAYRLAFVILILNGIPLLGYLYGADFLYALPRLTGIALQTATVFIALSIGVMVAVPEHGMLRMLRRNDAAGMLLRRLSLPMFVLPVLLGWLYLRGEELGYYDAEFGTAILVFLLVVLLAFVAVKGSQLVAEASSFIVEQSEKLRTTLASIGDAVIATDVNGIITLMNPVAETLTGWGALEAIGQPLTVVFHIFNEDTHQPVDNPALRALREGMIVGLANHTVLRAKDRTERPIDDSAAPIRHENGEVTGAVLIFRDVTERRLSDQMLRNSERRKDEFLATLAHELRNPLAPIRTSLHILQKAEADPAMRERVVEMMGRQIHHMVRLIDDLLEVTRITRGIIELRREKVELASVIGNAVETAMPAINAAGVQLTIDLNDEKLLVEVDPVRLAQVFVNLLNNAAKYTPHGGRVRLASRREGAFAAISVRDTGIGIPPDMLGRVFELFTRIESNRAHGGLGIGLALVKSLVQMHGGTVDAKSDGRGKGSEFVVRVPLSTSDGSTLLNGQIAPDKIHLSSPSRRILIVDDNRDAADSLAMFLRLERAEVLTVYDGLSALRATRTFKPEVLLLDIGMPVMDGYAVAEELRRDPQFQHVILIAMTGWGQQEDRYRTKAAGFNAHVVKPPNPPELVQLLNSLNHKSDADEFTDPKERSL